MSWLHVLIELHNVRTSPLTVYIYLLTIALQSAVTNYRIAFTVHYDDCCYRHTWRQR
jgi:hypothetical protein